MQISYTCEENSVHNVQILEFSNIEVLYILIFFENMQKWEKAPNLYIRDGEAYLYCGLIFIDKPGDSLRGFAVTLQT